MGDEEVKVYFDIFLVENRAYEAFCMNIGVRALRSDPHRFIVGAFSWASSPEGHNYWDKLNDKWRKTYVKLL